MKDKIVELLKDEEFVKQVNACENEEQALSVFREHGIAVGSESELHEVLAQCAERLSDDDLEAVSGGVTICIVSGFGFGLEACWSEGHSVGLDKPSGYGGGACFFIGAGVGLLTK